MDSNEIYSATNWPLYVNDDGVVYCGEHNCLDDTINLNDRGRIVDVGEWLEALKEHRNKYHKAQESNEGKAYPKAQESNEGKAYPPK